MFLYLGHAKGTREDCRVRAFAFLIDEKKKMLMRLSSVFATHPQPCSAHVQRLASTSTVRCVSVYLSPSIFLFRHEFARPHLFAIVPLLHFVFFSRYVRSCR